MDLLQTILTAMFCMAVVFGVLIVIYFLVSLSTRAIKYIEKLFGDLTA